jgi:hypothetical protein
LRATIRHCAGDSRTSSARREPSSDGGSESSGNPAAERASVAREVARHVGRPGLSGRPRGEFFDKVLWAVAPCAQRSRYSYCPFRGATPCASPPPRAPRSGPPVRRCARQAK